MKNEQMLKDAIEAKEIVTFVYNGKGRSVQPVALQGPVLLAWQVEGEASRPLPCIAHYTTSKMEGLRATGEAFDEYPGGWEPKKTS